MSRQHRGGYCPKPKIKMVRQQIVNADTKEKIQVIEAMSKSIAAKMDREMSRTATIITYMTQYIATTIEVLNETLDGDGCPFSDSLKKRGCDVVSSCDRFLDTFSDKLDPSCKQEYLDSYSQFQIAMDNYFRNSEFAYKQYNGNERAMEVSRAAALRYHDPLDKNPQRNFEAGFRMGAAYADIHPVGYVELSIGGTRKRVEMKDLIDCYVEKHKDDLTFEAKCSIK